MKKTYNKLQVEVVCANCGKSFLKDKTEVVRNENKGARHYCSYKCCGIANHQHLLDNPNGYDISQHSGEHRDEHTELRKFINSARKRGKECNLTVGYLKQVWDEQAHKCIYTNIPLVLPCYNYRKGASVNSTIYTASVDRIDSSQGYIEGNIQFVSMAINFMKHTMSHEQTLELINLIKSL